MKEEEIQQALIRLEKLHQSGHLSRDLFIEKRQALLDQWEKDVATSGAVPRPNVMMAPEELAPPLVTPPKEQFAMPPKGLITRHLPASHAPVQLHGKGIENLLDRQTAAEIRALNSIPRNAAPDGANAQGSAPPVHEPSGYGEARPGLHHGPGRAGGGPSQHPGGGPLPHAAPADIADSPPFAGDVLRGRFQLHTLLGAGGMGKVFLVEDLRFGGHYAAKVLHPWVVQHEPTISRFIQEFKMMEHLMHPGVVRTFALDEDPVSQSLFYLMEYVEGKTLQDVLERAIAANDGPPFTGEETLHFFEKLADILRYTHNKHVLHRDLKPTNIMLFQEAESDYGLKLLDFGLAKWIKESEDPALHTGHAGTFFYIAPEQLMGGSEALVAADIFSLGVVLYQMLTGALPVAMAIPPSEVNPQLPREIDTVMRKAMHANWQQRHQSVDELLHDLRRAFHGEDYSFDKSEYPSYAEAPSSGTHNSIRDLIGAVPPSSHGERSKARSDRKPSRDGRKSKSRDPSQWSRHPSPSDRRKSTKRNPQTPTPSRSTDSPSRTPRAQQVSNAERIARLRRSGRADSPLREKAASPSSSKSSPPRQAKGAPARISTSSTSAAVSSDRIDRVRVGRATGTSPTIKGSASKGRNNRRKQTQDRERFVAPLQSFQAHDKGGVAVVVSPDGKFLGSAGLDGVIHLWDTSSWFKLHTIESKFQITSMLWGPRDDSIAFGTVAGELQVWKTLSAQKIQSFKHVSPVKALAWLPGGTHILCGCEDASVTPWEIRTGKQERLIHTRHPSIRALTIDSGGYLLASASTTQPIKVWNLARHSLLLELSSQDNEILSAICFSPTDTILASGCVSGTTQIWEIQSGTVQYTTDKHQGAVHSVAFSPDGTWFATASEDATIKRWEVSTGRLLHTYRGHEEAIRALCISPDGQWIASLCDDGIVKIWEVTAQR